MIFTSSAEKGAENVLGDCANGKSQSFALLCFVGLEEITPRPVRDSGNVLKQGYLEKRSRGKAWQVHHNKSFQNASFQIKNKQENTYFLQICL